MTRDENGGEGRTLYLDTEGSFRPERLVPIAERFGLEADFVVTNVLYARIFNCDHLENAIMEAGALFASDDQEPFRVLVVDSIIGVYRQEFQGRGELAERQQRMGKVLWMLKKLAQTYNIAVILTNQVTADPGAMAGVDAKKAVGGNILAHAVDTRIMLRKYKVCSPLASPPPSVSVSLFSPSARVTTALAPPQGDQRIAKVMQSPLVGEAEATFR